MFEPQLRFLNQEDVITAGGLDMPLVLQLVEEAFLLDGLGRVHNPAKTMISIPQEEEWESRFISMPVYVGDQVNCPGVKWAAESTANARSGQLPMGIDVVMLSDPVTALPVVLMDATLITAMRTAAAAGVAAKHLAADPCPVVGCVGAGVVGRTMIMALQHVLQPGLIRLYDRQEDKARQLGEEFAGFAPVQATGSVQEAVEDADVIATMTTSRTPFVQTDWVKEGCTVLQMSAYEIETGVVEKADRLIVDSWAQMKENPASVFWQLLESGRLDESRITLLKDVVSGEEPGRQHGGETIVFGSRGLGCLDIMVAQHLWQKAQEQGLGQTLKLWDEPKWV